MEINLEAVKVDVKSSTIARLTEVLTLTTTEGTHDLVVKIEADFGDTPEQYHEVYLNMLTTKYGNKCSFTQNPFSQCLIKNKNKWWQFWKTNLNKK